MFASDREVAALIADPVVAPLVAHSGKRHFPAILTALILLAVLLASCGAQTPEVPLAPEGPTPTVTVPIEMPVVISVLGQYRSEDLDLLDQQIALFESQNPDILVELIEVKGSQADLRNELSERLATRSDALDIMLIDDAWLAGFAANDWLASLEARVQAAGVDMGAYLPGAVQASTIAGQLVALPWIVDGGLLYYRQDLLREQGLAPPGSWPELQQLALDLKNSGGPEAGHVWQGAAYESLTCNTLEFVWAYGGQVLDEGGAVVFDSPETRAALQAMVDLVESGASPPEVAALREGTSLAEFRSGDSAFMRNWPFAWDRLHRDDSAVAGQVGVAPLPASCLMGQTLALSAHSIYPEQAFRFMQFLTAYDQQLQVATDLGRPPALETVYGDTGLLAARPWFSSLHQALALTRPRPRTVAYDRVSEVIYTEVNQMISGKQGVEATAAAIQRHLGEILQP